MGPRYKINGRGYDSVEDMPPEDRRKYEDGLRMLAQAADAGKLPPDLLKRNAEDIARARLLKPNKSVRNSGNSREFTIRLTGIKAIVGLIIMFIILFLYLRYGISDS